MIQLVYGGLLLFFSYSAAMVYTFRGATTESATYMFFALLTMGLMELRDMAAELRVWNARVGNLFGAFTEAILETTKSIKENNVQ